MKKNILALLLSFASSFIYSQHYVVTHYDSKGNPNNLNKEYESTYGTGNAWSLIINGTHPIPFWSDQKSLPFDFQFNGNIFRKFRVCTNGLITFDTTTSLPILDYNQKTFPSDLIPNNSVGILGLACIGSQDYVIQKIFGTTPNRQVWVQFNSYSYTNNPSNNSLSTNWSIVFEETTNKIYVVDQNNLGYPDSVKQVSIGIQYDNKSSVIVPGSPNINAKSHNYKIPIDNSYYEFRPGNRKSYDIAFEKLLSDTITGISNYYIKLNIKNIGSETADSVEFNYKINNGLLVSSIITGLNLKVNESTVITHPIPWNITNKGDFSIDTWISKINGFDDENPSDNKNIFKIKVFSKNVNKRILFEKFSSSTCNPCKSSNQIDYNILEQKNKNDYVFISYPINYPSQGDPYATWEIFNNLNKYSILNYFIPLLLVNGYTDIMNKNLTDSIYNDNLNHFSAFDMAGNYQFDDSSKTINGKINYTSLINSDNSKLYIAIIEKETKNNVLTNGETSFRNVVKKMIPDENGIALSSTIDGKSDSISFSFQFHGAYRLPIGNVFSNPIDYSSEHSVENFSNLEVVAWIQNANNGVYQALNLSKSTTKIEELISINDVKIFPNPVVNQLNISFNAIKNDYIEINLYNLSGQLVKSMKKSVFVGENRIEMNTIDVTTGEYYLSIIDSKNNIHTNKILVFK